MAEELRLALILLGSLAIGAVVLHGIWTVRKNVNEERKLQAQDAEPEEIVLNDEELEIQSLKIKQMEMDFNTLASSGDSQGLPVVDVDVDSIYQENKEHLTNIEVEPQVEAGLAENTDGKAAYERETYNENQGVLLNDDMPSFSAVDSERTEPSISDSAVHGISAHELSGNESSTSENFAFESNAASKPSTPAEPEKSEVLILYVDKPEGEAIDGAKLLPILLTLGFKFGEMDFFHRHEQSSGHGEILFSLANMYNPGTFDIDNMEQVTTRGLSIFMTLPNAGEALQTFNMMHNAAKKIADEFGANVLDANRERLDVLKVRHYVEKIRKF
ncbi:cell division protein ZipA [Psychrosphaera haliotis]|uniref:Cell division protein ZipA n=1 Tax=Psychrosphaera haliotis TaxID=555083 RepID=A0A6N8F4B8_9GAMM|nr:cell division protein ZipA [Psychrosphaera haliotis]MUH71415.1 cell division protein ZipA [Psychrosphaera haliotis]